MRRPMLSLSALLLVIVLLLTAGGLAAATTAANDAADAPAGPAANLGFVGSSTSDDLGTIDLDAQSYLTPTLDFLPEGNYPYDVTINPAGTEAWVVGASGDGAVVLDN